MFCPSCGSQIDACASICFNCARRSTESGGGESGAQVKSVLWTWAPVALILVAGAAWLIFT